MGISHPFPALTSTAPAQHARDEPLDRPLANVGAVWYAHERERKPGYPKGLRVLLENVFQNDVVHAVMSKQAVEHYEGVDAIPEGGTQSRKRVRNSQLHWLLSRPFSTHFG